MCFRKKEKKLPTVIECRMSDDMLVQKSDVVDFVTKSQLIVRESQQALFFLDGQTMDIFTQPGRYTLDTTTLPLLTKKQKKERIGKIRSEIYFINGKEQMSIRWGTDTRFTYFSRKENLPVNLGARGEMSLRVTKPSCLVSRLVGTNADLKSVSVVEIFDSLVKSQVMSQIPATLTEMNVSIYDIDSYISECSGRIQVALNRALDEYGLSVPMFRIVAFSKDESFEGTIETHTEIYKEAIQTKAEQDLKARATKVQAEAEAAKRSLEGYTYQEEKGYEIELEKIKNQAKDKKDNPKDRSSVKLTDIESVLGTASGAFEELMTQIVKPEKSSGSQIVPDDKMKKFEEQVRKLKFMKDQGIISDSEFEAERQRLLNQI